MRRDAGSELEITIHCFLSSVYFDLSVLFPTGFCRHRAEPDYSSDFSAGFVAREDKTLAASNRERASISVIADPQYE